MTVIELPGVFSSRNESLRTRSLYYGLNLPSENNKQANTAYLFVYNKNSSVLSIKNKDSPFLLPKGQILSCHTTMAKTEYHPAHWFQSWECIPDSSLKNFSFPILSTLLTYPLPFPSSFQLANHKWIPHV